MFSEKDRTNFPLEIFKKKIKWYNDWTKPTNQNETKHDMKRSKIRTATTKRNEFNSFRKKQKQIIF